MVKCILFRSVNMGNTFWNQDSHRGALQRVKAISMMLAAETDHKGGSVWNIKCISSRHNCSACTPWHATSYFLCCFVPHLSTFFVSLSCHSPLAQTNLMALMAPLMLSEVFETGLNETFPCGILDQNSPRVDGWPWPGSEENISVDKNDLCALWLGCESECFCQLKRT